MPSLLVARRSPQLQRSSFEGRCCRTASNSAQQEQQQLFGSITDLPTLVIQRIVLVLDPASRLELRKVNKLCRHAVDSSWKLVCIPLDQVKQHGMEQVEDQFPSASCLVISASQQPISLSILGRRRRCEQILSVLLDNTVQPPTNLVALDISHSVSSVTSATLQVLVEALPGLQHLALPAVAGTGSSGQWDVLRLLGQMQQLQSCELDCTYFAVGRHSGHEQHTHSVLQATTQSTVQQEAIDSHQLPVQLHQQLAPASQQDQQHSMTLGLGTQQHSGAGQTVLASLVSTLAQPVGSNQADTSVLHSRVQQQEASSNGTNLYSNYSAFRYSALQPGTVVAAADSSLQQCHHQQPDPQRICQLLPLQPQPCRPWANLSNLRHLQQLQLSHPCHLQELFDNLQYLTQLASLGLVRVQRGFSCVLLDPGVGDCGQGLGQLKCLQSLTRLELGLDTQCSSDGTSSSSPTARLVTPPHISTSEHHLPRTSPPAITADGLYAPELYTATSAAPGPIPAAGVVFSHHSCCWSHLAQLRVLALSGGICLDMPLLAATADCVHLTELRASGMLLETDAPVAFKGLLQLRVLTVTQRFSLGGNPAAAMFPALEKLSIKDDGLQWWSGGQTLLTANDSNRHPSMLLFLPCSPDLSCLKHHSSLTSLAIEAPSSGWQLASLQLGYLVHLDTLKQLSLASRCWGPAGHVGQLGVQSPVSPGGIKSPGVLRCGNGTLQASNSSHWLPTATLTQVTSLTLAGPANDHTLSQLPSQFPGLVTLQLLGSYYASDWGLKKLSRSPHLSSLLLEGCEHVTEYGLEALLRGGSIKMLAVHGCGGVDERACQRIRRACRYSCANLSWHGTDGLQNLQHLQHHHGKHTSGSNSSVTSSSGASGWATSSIASADSHHDLSYFDTDGQHCNFGSSNEPSPSRSAAAVGSRSSSSRVVGAHQCSSGSESLERCWREGLAIQRNATAVAGEVLCRLSSGKGACSSGVNSCRSTADYGTTTASREMHLSSSSGSDECHPMKAPSRDAGATCPARQQVTVVATAGGAAASAASSVVTASAQALCTPATAAATSSNRQGEQAAVAIISVIPPDATASLPLAEDASCRSPVGRKAVSLGSAVSSAWGCNSSSHASGAAQRSGLAGCAR